MIYKKSWKYILFKDYTYYCIRHNYYRLMALKDFSNVKRGYLGGYLRYYYNLSQTGDCWVYDSAQISGDARVDDDAQVCDSAKVYGLARISKNARVYGNAQVYGNARVSGSAHVCGRAQVYGNAQVYGDARVFGYNNQICGNKIIKE